MVDAGTRVRAVLAAGSVAALVGLAVSTPAAADTAPVSPSTPRTVSADLLPAQYAEAVTSVGGVPVLLPPTEAPGAAAAAVARLDGLVLSGGADVDPERYGAEPHPAMTAVSRHRSA